MSMPYANSIAVQQLNPFMSVQSTTCCRCHQASGKHCPTAPLVLWETFSQCTSQHQCNQTNIQNLSAYNSSSTQLTYQLAPAQPDCNLQQPALAPHVWLLVPRGSDEHTIVPTHCSPGALALIHFHFQSYCIVALQRCFLATLSISTPSVECLLFQFFTIFKILSTA